MQNEALILEISHGTRQYFEPVGTGKFREPSAIFVGWILTNPTQIRIHGESERIGADTTIARMIVARLEHHSRVGGQKFHHKTVVDQSLVIELIQQGVVPEAGPSLIHDLGLSLRVKVLRHLAHDANNFPLPGFQQRRVFLDKIQEVLLRLLGKTLLFLVARLHGLRNRAPQCIEIALYVFRAFHLAALFLLGRDGMRPLVAVHPIVHERMAGIENFFHRLRAITFFRIADVFLGEYQIVDDGAGIRPGPEQVIAFEE